MEKNTLPLVAVLVAVVITSTMDFTGYTMFSALPLSALILIFWFINKISLVEIGLKFGALKYYGLSLLYPAIVLGLTVIAGFLFGDASIPETDWNRLSKVIFFGTTIGTIMLILTEEGFFRGWLWGTFNKSGMSDTKTLIITTLCFTIWHIPATLSGAEFGLPLHQIPVFLTNVVLLGLIWGLMRQLSGSVIVPAVCHAVWNTFAYELFGFGEKIGSLGITNTIVFGPEVGVLGIILNGTFFLWLWRKAKMG